MSEEREQECGIEEETMRKKGLALILQDLKQKELIPLKMIFFLLMGGLVVLFPYMTIHMTTLGMTIEEIAVISGVYPLFTIVSTYTSGVVADKMGNFKVLLSVLIGLGSVNALLFLAIPQARDTINYPTNVSLAIGCMNNSHPSQLTLTNLDSCPCTLNQKSLYNLTLVEPFCGYLCYPSERYLHNDSGDLNAMETVDWSQRRGEKVGDATFFREEWNLELACSTHENCHLIQTFLKPQTNFFIENGSSDTRHATFVAEQFSYEGRSMQSVQCGSYDRPVYLRQPFISNTSNSNDLHGNQCNDRNSTSYQICRPQCIVHINQTTLCDNKAHVIEHNPQLTFWVYLIIRILLCIVLEATFTILDGASLAVIMKVNGDVGMQNIFGIIGKIAFSPISGILTDYYSIGSDTANFRPAYYIYAGMMGLTVTVSGLSALPALLLSDKIFRKMGHPNVQVLGFYVYVIRLIGYSFIKKPYECLIFAAFESVTTALMTVSAMTYSAQLGTIQTLGTIQGIVGGSYYGMGRGMGSLIGGFLNAKFGWSWGYRIISITAFLTGSSYLLFNMFYIRKKKYSASVENANSDSEEPAPLIDAECYAGGQIRG